MGITKRFVLLLSLGLLLLALAAALHISLTVFVVYNLICAALLILDYLLSPDAASLTIERSGDDSLSMYEKEHICFEVYNGGIYDMKLEMLDEIPEFHFQAEGKLMSGIVRPNEKKHFEYAVTPTKRGAFNFGNLHVKYAGRLGLCTKLFKRKLDREYKIYPNMKNLRKYRLGITNNRMFKQGQRNLRMSGKGTSFESLREYVPGDEYRKINWQATARAGWPIINQYEPEKNQHVYALIDTGRPMSHTVRGYRKLDMVVNTALVLSDIVNQNGDQSGLLLFNTEVGSMIAPGKGVGHRNKILEALYHIEHTNLTSNYDEAFFYFKRKERHRSIIFLFTDFDTVEEAEYMLRVLPTISGNNIVVVVLIRNESLEEIGAGTINNREDLFNKGVALELMEERRKIMSLLNRKGVLCVECPAEKLEYTAVNKYIEIKNRKYL